MGGLDIKTLSCLLVGFFLILEKSAFIHSTAALILSNKPKKKKKGKLTRPSL
jgi:hypothetical protein